MKQFIYLDTDIISSIIAQSEQGIVTQVSYENTDSEEDHDEDKAKASAKGSITGKLFKALKADVSIGAEYENSFGQSYQNSTKEIIEKVLHDANFAIAYDYISPFVVKQGNTDYCEEGNYLELYRVFDFIDFDYLRGLFAKDGVMDFIKRTEAEKIETAAKTQAESSIHIISLLLLILSTPSPAASSARTSPGSLDTAATRCSWVDCRCG